MRRIRVRDGELGSLGFSVGVRVRIRVLEFRVRFQGLWLGFQGLGFRVRVTV